MKKKHGKNFTGLSNIVACVTIMCILAAIILYGLKTEDNIDAGQVCDAGESGGDNKEIYGIYEGVGDPEELHSGVHAPRDEDILAYMMESADGFMQTAVIMGDDEEKASEALRPCVVKIMAGNERGSGIILDIDLTQPLRSGDTKDRAGSPEGEILILTCRHVAVGVMAEAGEEEPSVPASGIRVTFFTGHEVEASVRSISEERDAAVLAVDASQLYVQELLRLRKIRKGGVLSKQDALWYAASVDTPLFERWDPGRWDFDLGGRDIDVGNHIIKGSVIEPLIEVSALDRDMLYADMEGSPGMSGGGIFDGSGNLAGILVGGVNLGGVVAEPVQEILR